MRVVGTAVCLALGMTAATAQPAELAGGSESGIIDDVFLSVGSTIVNGTCFLNNFRSVTAEQAQHQGIDLGHHLSEDFTVGSVSFSVTLMVVGGLLLAAGYKLVGPALFAVGFAGGFMAAFSGTSAFFNAFPQLFSCWALTIVPVVGGCVLGSLALKVVKLAFAFIGAVTGGIVGFYAYVLIGLQQYESEVSGSIHWVYYACLMGPALLCGCCSVKLENKILAFATSLVGGFSFVIGADYLILLPIDRRFTDWISPLNRDHAENFTASAGGQEATQLHNVSGYTLASVGAAVVLSCLGTVWQLRMQRSDDYARVSYGGDPKP